MAQDDYHKHLFAQIAQKALIEKDGKILMVQYPNDDHNAANKWDLPGGRLHQHESPIEGVKREVEEEIGAPINVHEIITTGVVIVNENLKFYVVLYRASLVDPNATLTPEAGEIGKLEWRDKQDLLTLPMLNSVFTEAYKANLL